MQLSIIFLLDYKLLLAGSRLYVYCIIKGNAGICPSGPHPISGVKDSLGKLHRERHMVWVLTLARFTSVLKLLLFQFNNWSVNDKLMTYNSNNKNFLDLAIVNLRHP